MSLNAIFDDVTDFFDSLGDRFRRDADKLRREDRELELEIEDTGSDSAVKPKVVGIDLKAKENAKRHNCDTYELITRTKNTAIIRRGGSLLLEIEFNQDVNLKKIQELTIYFNFGSRPLVSKGTQAILQFTGKKQFDKSPEEWDHRVVSQEGTKATVEIQVPDDVPVGVWMMVCSTKNRDGEGEKHIYRSDDVLYILFNPWNKADDVYMPNEEKRQEYVLNDVGKIWVGGYPTARGRQWVFGQFDDAVLPACVLLMEKSGLNPEQRGDPVVVSRAISKMVNSNDDRGVIVGRWDGKYENGTAPSEWTGSIKIMEDYMRKNAPVKYGQCWVFSGVTTTVCRALGIPSRSVSNMNSAHDTNMSLTIDKYFDAKGEEFKPERNVVPSGHGDSIWNFHVWNDVWMARPDLPAGYGGWQAIDATPQELSHGIYQCGPASLEAVKNGQSNLNYDVNFVLAEVNADVVNWQQDEDSSDGFKKLTSNKTHIGRQVLTKKVGKTDSGYYGNDKEDCTQDYKPREGTNAERVTLHSAARRTRAARHAFRFPSVAEEDVEFELIDIDRVPIGQDFQVAVVVKNLSESSRTVNLVLSATSEYYTGIKAEVIKRAEGSFKLKPGEKETLRLPVSHNEYYDKLVEYAMIKLNSIANVKETTQTWIDNDIFQVIKPAIKIELLGDPIVNKPLPVKFSFLNPLNKELRNCILIIDGPGLTRPKKIPLENVEANKEMTYQINVYPKLSGNKSLVATFNSKELIDVTGSTPVETVT